MVKRSQRLVALFAAVIILFEVAAVPQKAKAVAASVSVVAAVAAIMTACGVSYWAASQTDAVEYLGGKIDEYLNTFETVPVSYAEWLGISGPSQLFQVVSDGVMSFGSGVASKILDFVRWFNQDEGVVSDGPTVGLLAGTVPVYSNWLLSGDDGSAVFELDPSTSSFRVRFDDVKCYDNRNIYNVALEIPGATAVRITIDTVDPGNTYRINVYGTVAFGVSDTQDGSGYSVNLRAGNTNLYTSNQPRNYVFLTFNNPTPYTNAEDVRHYWEVSGTLEIEGGLGALGYPDRAKVTPSAVVSVPDVSSDQAAPFVVTTNAALTQGMTVEDGTTALMDAVTTADGLASEVEGDSEPEGGVLEGWGWLSDTLDAIHDFVAGIAQTVLGIPQAIGQAASDVITGVGNAISTALYNAFVPSEAAIDAFVATLSGNFDNHFSILSYPFSLLGRFVLEVVDAPGDHELVWPDIYEPFSGQRLIAAGSYNLDNALANENFRTAYDIYMTVIKGYIAFQFIAYLYAWFCDVFRMRNDDYANPIFEQEPIDDGPDDWDGYDSYFET